MKAPRSAITGYGEPKKNIGSSKDFDPTIYIVLGKLHWSGQLYLSCQTGSTGLALYHMISSRYSGVMKSI